MGIGDEEGGNDVLFLGLHARHAFATATLAAEVDQRSPFDIATGRHSHDHVFAGNQVFVVHVPGPINDLGASRNGKLISHLGQFVRNDAHDPVAAPQNFKVFLDFLGELFQFVSDFLDADLG